LQQWTRTDLVDAEGDQRVPLRLRYFGDPDDLELLVAKTCDPNQLSSAVVASLRPGNSDSSKQGSGSTNGISLVALSAESTSSSAIGYVGAFNAEFVVRVRRGATTGVFAVMDNTATQLGCVVSAVT